MLNCLHTVLWRYEVEHLYEYATFTDMGQGCRFEGVVITAVGGKPTRIEYQVECDQQGITRLAEVKAMGGLGEHHLQLTADEERIWRLNGAEIATCRDALDVDLGFSPATNTLPMRRLNLQPGDSQTLTAAWVRFPELDVIAFPQRYTRLDTYRYRFESLLNDFKAELEIDDCGIVQRYGSYWEAVAGSRTS